MKKMLLVLVVCLQCGCSYVIPTFHCATLVVANPVQAINYCEAFYNEVESEEKLWCNTQDIWPEKCWKYRTWDANYKGNK